jgi:hypothetical protein
MVVTLVCCLLATILLGTPALAIDANAWRTLPEGSRGMYVVGVVDAWADVKSASEMIKKAEPAYVPSPAEKLYGSAWDCMGGRPLNQIIAIVEKYVKDHPENWDATMPSHIWNALQNLCKQ